MLCGKRKQCFQEECSSSSAEQGQDIAPKRICDGLSTWNTTLDNIADDDTHKKSHPYVKSNAEVTSQNGCPLQNKSGSQQTLEAMESCGTFTSNLYPSSPRRCLRCLSGESGHINHILIH